MISSFQIVLGTTPMLLASGGSKGKNVYIKCSDIYVGPLGVTASTGLHITDNGFPYVSLVLPGGDELYGLTAAGQDLVSVLVAG